MAYLGTLLTIETLSKSLSILYKGIEFSSTSYENLKINHKLTKELYNATSEIVEDLEQIDKIISNTGRAKNLLVCIISCLDLCKEYEKKNRLKKFIYSGSFKKKFFLHRLKLHIYFIELIESTILISEYHEDHIEIDDKAI